MLQGENVAIAPQGKGESLLVISETLIGDCGSGEPGGLEYSRYRYGQMTWKIVIYSRVVLYVYNLWISFGGSGNGAELGGGIAARCSEIPAYLGRNFAVLVMDEAEHWNTERWKLGAERLYYCCEICGV